MTALAKPLLAQLQFPAALKSDDPRVKQLGVREAGFLRRLSKDFRIPESYQATFGFERELARGLFQSSTGLPASRPAFAVLIRHWGCVPPSAPPSAPPSGPASVPL